MEYWEECVSEAFDEAGITATKEQVETVASLVEGAHENHGMAHGYECIPSQSSIEIEKLKRELQAEREKVPCEVCGGTGRIVTHGPCHSAESSCWKCGGEGRHPL